MEEQTHQWLPAGQAGGGDPVMWRFLSLSSLRGATREQLPLQYPPNCPLLMYSLSLDSADHLPGWLTHHPPASPSIPPPPPPFALGSVALRPVRMTRCPPPLPSSSCLFRALWSTVPEGGFQCANVARAFYLCPDAFHLFQFGVRACPVEVPLRRIRRPPSLLDVSLGS